MTMISVTLIENSNHVLCSEMWMKITNPTLSRSVFVKTIVTTNFAAKNVLVTKRNWMNWMNMSVITWKIFQSKPNESCKELLDSWFYFGMLIILLLYTVSSVPTSCISIKPYWTVTNIETELLKGFLDKWITSKKDVIWEKSWKFILVFFPLDYQE